MIYMSDNQKYVETPLMKQYYQVKAKHPDAILLFRVGDFYETLALPFIKTTSVFSLLKTNVRPDGF